MNVSSETEPVSAFPRGEAETHKGSAKAQPFKHAIHSKQNYSFHWSSLHRPLPWQEIVSGVESKFSFQY